jgi:hypothetical protein
VERKKKTVSGRKNLGELEGLVLIYEKEKSWLFLWGGRWPAAMEIFNTGGG